MKRLTTLLATLLSATAMAADLPAPLTNADFRPVDRAEAELGWLLFYDPILSGNREVACATCHHPRFATSDGVSLGLGDGGMGLGPARRPDPANLPEQRIPRNAPALFNLGANEFTVLFHDGRIEADPTRPGGLRTPLGPDMVAGFDGLLSAQTMFPVLSPDEMAGHYSENEIAQAVRLGRITGEGGAWELISRRVAALPAYAEGFAAIYPEIAEGRAIAFTDISNAIAAFMEFEWRADDSPFDRHLRGEEMLEGAAADGMTLFFGAAGCAACHSGPFQTDHGFHAMGVPQIGPGKAARFETHARDTGRMRVTGREADAYAFRTPSLRNVVATGPYGHAGAEADLRRFVATHLTPSQAARGYARDSAVLAPLPGAQDWRILDEKAERAAIEVAAAPDGPTLSEDQIDALLAFLAALTDEASLAGRLGVPEGVPSGLPVP
jgi:cytochrome c peroxidase